MWLDLHSELQDKPAHFLDTLVAVASSAWSGILTVVTVSVVDLGAMIVFFGNDHTKIAGPKRFKIIKIAIFESWSVGWPPGIGWF